MRRARASLLAGADSPFEALRQRVNLFVDFLVTKHGLADALQSDSSRFAALHTYFLDRLEPVCAQLLGAAVDAGDIRPGTRPVDRRPGPVPQSRPVPPSLRVPVWQRKRRGAPARQVGDRLSHSRAGVP